MNMSPKPTATTSSSNPSSNPNPRSPASSAGYPSKRARHSPPEDVSPSPVTTATTATVTATSKVNAHSNAHSNATSNANALAAATSAGQSSSFRNVSACNRCRLRKNRCDQRLPSCASCEKANVKCVGYDPITKREIPRR